MALPKKRTESCAAASGATLLDQLMPVFEFGHCHTIIVEAAVRMVAAGIEAYRLDQSFLVRLLFRLRGLGPAPGTLRGSLINRGFTLLAEESGREVVVGIAGRFWHSTSWPTWSDCGTRRRSSSSASQARQRLPPIFSARHSTLRQRDSVRRPGCTVLMQPLTVFFPHTGRSSNHLAPGSAATCFSVCGAIFSIARLHER